MIANEATRSATGTLFVVATPIGNLEDLSPRAARILCEVAFVAAEDTRRTATLLRHVGSNAAMLVADEHHEQRAAQQIAQHLAAGNSVALVSDAGMPAISDPVMTISVSPPLSCAKAGAVPPRTSAETPHAAKSCFFIDPTPVRPERCAAPYRKLE